MKQTELHPGVSDIHGSHEAADLSKFCSVVTTGLRLSWTENRGVPQRPV